MPLVSNDNDAKLMKTYNNITIKQKIIIAEKEIETIAIVQKNNSWYYYTFENYYCIVHRKVHDVYIDTLSLVL